MVEQPQMALVERAPQTALQVAASPMRAVEAGAVILMLRRQAVRAVQVAEVQVAWERLPQQRLAQELLVQQILVAVAVAR
jgi:hypothetical protein